ncbi:MAG: 4Fe-4S binding protein [Phycisphaerales bacterium]|nr:MAG: 4Fe-4S binding protein [Phycisphaerales bacterium]
MPPREPRQRKPRANAAKPRAVALPVLNGGSAGAPRTAIRPSRNARKRALVLIGVHVVIVIHVLLWLRFGRTLSPVEPSESMYTLETGVINAGFVFFILAILSTLIFGRFFCGWACHVVALQDLCAWLLKKIGIRPRPFRSRLLVFVPLFFALYMFVWPTVRRDVVAPLLENHWPAARPYLGHVQPFPGFSDGLITEDFWATFPGPLIAIPFLFICGFVCVYFLGAKGFCTYGCPYGGFFAPADKIAPGRIVVDHDKCEGCGHCTAVCTSNVRVHEEIRDYGMVVDPGCMKCMDCVSVCPNDALAFTFAAPPIAKSTKRGRARDDAPATKPARKPGATRTYDLTWPEEIAITVVFALAFLATRGAYDAIPMLMAIGVAACVAFMAWKSWRLAFDANVRMHNFQLRLKGALRPAAYAFIPLALLTFAFTAQAGATRALLLRAGAHERHVNVPISVALSPERAAIPPDDLDAARRAERLHRLASSWRDGGVGLGSTPSRAADHAYLLAVLGDFAGAERALRILVERSDLSEPAARHIATLMAAQGRPAEALDFIVGAIDEHPEFHALRADAVASLAQSGRVAEAAAILDRAVQRRPNDGAILAQRAAFRITNDDAEAGMADIRRAIELAPDDAAVRQQYAAALAATGELDAAIEQMRIALDLDTLDHIPALRIAQMLVAAGRTREAAPYLDIAEERRRKQAERQPAHQHTPPSATTVTRDE